MALLDEEQDPENAPGPSAPAAGEDPLEHLKKYLSLIPKAPATPRPELPVGADPEIARAAQERLGTLAGIQGFAGLRTVTPYDVKQGIRPSTASSLGYEAAVHAAGLPVQQEQGRVERINKSNEILNKWMEAQAGRGVKEQADITAILGKYLQGQTQQGVAGVKAGTAKDVANINAKAKTDAVKLQMGGPVDATVIDREADRYNSGDGEIHTPKGLRGPAAISFVQAVQKRAAEKLNAPGAGPAKPLVAVAAENKANAASLGKLTATADQMNMFEGTAVKNLGVLKDALSRIRDTGSPLLNKPMRDWDKTVMGAPEMAAYNAARTIVTPEVAKVLQSSTGNGVLTDTAQKHVDTVLDPNATAEQQLAAIDVILKDFANRKGSAAGTIKEVKSRIGGNPTPDKQVVKWQRNVQTGKRRPVYSDGSYGPEQ